MPPTTTSVGDNVGDHHENRRKDHLTQLNTADVTREITRKHLKIHQTPHCLQNSLKIHWRQSNLASNNHSDNRANRRPQRTLFNESTNFHQNNLSPQQPLAIVETIDHHWKRQSTQPHTLSNFSIQGRTHTIATTIPIVVYTKTIDDYRVDGGDDDNITPLMSDLDTIYPQSWA